MAVQLEDLSKAVDGFIVTSSVFSVLMLGMGGRLLPTWMFFNSM